MSEPTLPGFVEWLSRKDPNERYEWPRAEICACGQYAKSIGVDGWIARGDDTWPKLNLIAKGNASFDDSEWTFGKCLDRAKKELV